MVGKSRAAAVCVLLVGPMVASLLVGALLTPAGAAYSTRLNSSWSPTGPVNAMARDGGRMYIGGDFTRLCSGTPPCPGSNGLARGRVAAMDVATGAPVAGFTPSVNGQVWAMAVGPDGTVYLGGDFTQVNGAPASRVAALTPQGELLPGFEASVTNSADDAVVYDLVVMGSSLYVGGGFARVNGTARSHLAKVDRATGAVDTAFNAQVAGGRVRALTAAGGRLFVGGKFGALGPAARSFLGEVDPTTGAATSWAPPPACADCPLLDLATDGARVIGGTQGLGGWAVSWSAASGARQWARRGDGDVQAVDVQGSIVYATGHFGPTFSGVQRHQLVALNAADGAILPYQVGFTGADKPGVWAVQAEADKLFLGGAFWLAGGAQARYATFDAVPDLGVPAAPTDVVARVSNGRVVLGWTAPASDGGSAIQRYDVVARPAPTNGATVCSTAALTCEVAIGDRDLRDGATYRFTVRAVNEQGAGPASGESDPLLIDLVPPSVSALGQAWGTVTDGSAEYAWAPVDPADVAGYEYRVRAAKHGKAWGRWSQKPATTSREVALPVAVAVTKCLQVRAFDASGNRSPWSGEVCRSAPADDRALGGRGTVARVSDAAAYRTSLTRAVGSGSLLRAGRLAATQAQLVTTSCPQCGKVEVRYDGRRVKRISTAGATRTSQVLTLLPSVRGVSRIDLVPVGASRVLVDGLSLRAR